MVSFKAVRLTPDAFHVPYTLHLRGLWDGRLPASRPGFCRPDTADRHDPPALGFAPYWSQFKETVMPLAINETAPDFTADSTEGKLHFYDWAGDNWVLFFSHPKDFTPVCTTELGAVAKLKPEFDKRGVKVLGLSVDSVNNHDKWADDILEAQG